ncbi:hypothetical protein GQ53DRAFT_182544 [Thozetella sp. PMI_491]|nr:hypothetical protein GQ53DRAFT_182544 [Thozetella sp. PMI_491]
MTQATPAAVPRAVHGTAQNKSGATLCDQSAPAPLQPDACRHRVRLPRRPYLAKAVAVMTVSAGELLDSGPSPSLVPTYIYMSFRASQGHHQVSLLTKFTQTIHAALSQKDTRKEGHRRLHHDQTSCKHTLSYRPTSHHHGQVPLQEEAVRRCLARVRRHCHAGEGASPVRRQDHEQETSVLQLSVSEARAERR